MIICSIEMKDTEMKSNMNMYTLVSRMMPFVFLNIPNFIYFVRLVYYDFMFKAIKCQIDFDFAAIMSFMKTSCILLCISQGALLGYSKKFFYCVTVMQNDGYFVFITYLVFNLFFVWNKVILDKQPWKQLRIDDIFRLYFCFDQFFFSKDLLKLLCELLG